MTFYNKYVIVYTSLFQNELEKILRYIAFNLDSPNIARSFYKKNHKQAVFSPAFS